MAFEMTAADAKRITCEALTVDMGKVRIVLDCWCQAIEKAAREGRTFTRESDVVRVRTIIPESARAHAFSVLRGRGFNTKSVPTGPCECEMEVSW